MTDTMKIKRNKTAKTSQGRSFLSHLSRDSHGHFMDKNLSSEANSWIISVFVIFVCNFCFLSFYSFIPDEDIVARMRHTFMGQWDINEDESQEKIAEALKHPENYVLKPNREGGGNNFYGSDLVAKIQAVTGTAKAQEFILMELIQPVVTQENYFIRPDRPPERVATISEVSVFGVILAKAQRVICNKAAQEVLVRAKASDSHEGAICTGHACYGSVVTS